MVVRDLGFWGWGLRLGFWGWGFQLIGFGACGVRLSGFFWSWGLSIKDKRITLGKNVHVEYTQNDLIGYVI